jgi:integrase
MKQQGHVFKASGSWYVKYREDAIENGQLVRKLRTHRLALEDDMCRTVSDAKNLAEEFLAPLNRNALTAESTVSVRDFTEKTYLPYVKESKRASTYKGYRDIWNVHIGPRIGKLRMRNVNTPVIYRTLRSIAFERDLTSTTLGHIKAMLSGLFRHAINVGAYQGSNPVRDAELPKGRKGKQTQVYSYAEVARALAGMDNLLLKSVVAVAAYAGLREAEIAGLEWTDYRGDSIDVNRSKWRGHVNPPKSTASDAPVPAIGPLRSILDAYRTSTGNPKSGPMFPLDLNALARRIRDRMESAGVIWKGYHAFRRGLASNLFELGVPDVVVQRILRHSKVQVTREKYIKLFDPTVQAAMDRLEEQVIQNCSKDQQVLSGNC